MISEGQLTLDPVQDSAGSHTLVLARQTAVESTLAGQLVLLPEQTSTISQTPLHRNYFRLFVSTYAEARQTVPKLMNLQNESQQSFGISCPGSHCSV